MHQRKTKHFIAKLLAQPYRLLHTFSILVLPRPSILYAFSLQERLSDLEQTVKRGKESLDEKKTNLASTERAVRDGNVVNNRMIQDIQLKTNQHKQIEQVNQEE